MTFTNAESVVRLGVAGSHPDGEIGPRAVEPLRECGHDLDVELGPGERDGVEALRRLMALFGAAAAPDPAPGAWAALWARIEAKIKELRPGSSSTCSNPVGVPRTAHKRRL
jgi:hypothetical protein